MLRYFRNGLTKFAYSIVSFILSVEFFGVVSATEWEMISTDGKIRTRPLAKEDYDYWYGLQASTAATALFRDGLPRNPEQVTPQADRSLKRLEEGDPRFIHVVELNTNDFGWKKVGTIVLGGSDIPNYFELAGLSHPAIIKTTGDYLKEVDIEAIKRGELGFNQEDPNLIPIWGQHYAQKVLGMILKNHLPKARGIVTSEFNGPSHEGIIATSSNPASEKLLEYFSFVRSENMEMSRFGVPKWVFTLKFE